MDDRAVREEVDPVIVPVHQDDEVVEPETPGRVLRLVVCAGRVTSLALYREHAHLARPGVLERQRLTDRGRHAVTRGAGVELEEERLALHLGVARQVPVVAQPQELLPEERPLLLLIDLVARVARLSVTDAQSLVVDSQQGVDDRAAVPRHEDEAVPEGLFGVADVPAHARAERRCDEQRHLRARPAGLAALSQVERQIDELIDQVACLLPVMEVTGERLEAGLREGLHGGSEGCPEEGPSMYPKGARAVPRHGSLTRQGGGRPRAGSSRGTLRALPAKRPVRAQTARAPRR